MNSVRIALVTRTLRIRKALRQDDLARIAKVSRSKVSRVERGMAAGMVLGDLDRIAVALGATLEIRLRWRGEQLDRLLDEAHARLVEVVVGILRASGWEVAVEVSYSIWGERGSIDVLAYHRRTGIVLIVEVKSVVPDIQSTLHGLDRKTRLARQIAEERGWACRGVARLLVIGHSATSRRRVARLWSTYSVAFPVRGVEVRQWVRAPAGSISGLLFLSFGQGMRNSRPPIARQRVRRRVLRQRQGEAALIRTERT